MSKVILSDHLKQYYDALPDNCQHGLMIGQFTKRATLVAHLIPTPAAADGQTNVSDSWIAKHAQQVALLLPGGLHVVGVFTVVARDHGGQPDSVLRSRDAQLRATLSAIYRQLGKLPRLHPAPPPLALTLALTAARVACRQHTFTDSMTPATAETVKHSYRAIGWRRFATTIGVDHTADINCNVTPFRQFSESLEPVLQRVGAARCLLVAGSLCCDTSQTVGACLTATATASATGPPHTVFVQLLSPLEQCSTDAAAGGGGGADDRAAVVMRSAEGSAELVASGRVYCECYLTDDSTMADVLAAFDCDVRRSVYARLRMHCDSLAVTGNSLRCHDDDHSGRRSAGDHTSTTSSASSDHTAAATAATADDDETVLHELPRRVLAPLVQPDVISDTGDVTSDTDDVTSGGGGGGGHRCLRVSDYLFPGDTPSDSLATLSELFSVSVSAQLVTDTVETFSDEAAHSECSSVADMQMLAESVAACGALYSSDGLPNKLLAWLSGKLLLCSCCFICCVAVLVASILLS